LRTPGLEFAKHVRASNVEFVASHDLLQSTGFSNRYLESSRVSGIAVVTAELRFCVLHN